MLIRYIARKNNRLSAFAGFARGSFLSPLALKAGGVSVQRNAGIVNAQYSANPKVFCKPSAQVIDSNDYDLKRHKNGLDEGECAINICDCLGWARFDSGSSCIMATLSGKDNGLFFKTKITISKLSFREEMAGAAIAAGAFILSAWGYSRVA